MLLAALLLQAAPVAPQCPAADVVLPTNLSGWGVPGAEFGVNKAVTLQAGDLAKLADVPAGTRPGGAVMIGFRID